MTPEEILRPFLKEYALPDDFVSFLFLLILREIEQGFPCTRDPLRLAQALDEVLKRLPPLAPDGLRAPIAQLVNLSELTPYLYRLVPDPDIEYYNTNRKSLLSLIENSQSLIDMADEKYERNRYRDDLRRYKRELQELKEPEPTPYLRQFWNDLSSYQLSFRIPEQNRFEHTHIIGSSGSGKSSLLTELVCQDMQTSASVIVLTPKGDDLVANIARIPHERTICITDWQNVGLNLFDLDPDLVVYVFESLLKSEPTQKQKAFLMQALKECSSMAEFRALVARTRGNPKADYVDTAKEITWRLDLVPPLVDEILSRPTTLDIPGIMDTGGVLLLDTAKLKGGSAFTGRFITALVAKATTERMNRRGNRPCYVYIDECQDYLTDSMTEILDKARAAKVGLTLAHQNLSQLAEHSARLEQTVLTTSIRFVGRVGHQDASRLAPILKMTADQLTHRRKYHFAFYAHDFLDHPLQLTTTEGFINKFPERPTAPQHIQPPSLRLTHQSTAPQNVDSEEPDAW